MNDPQNDPIFAFALGGLAGNNAHGAGFLYRATQHGFQPQIISCTSGQIAWAYQYLKAHASGADLREIFERDIAELHVLHNINLDYARFALIGKPGVFRLAYPEYSLDLARNMLQAYSDLARQRGNVFWLETMLRTLPGRMLVPDFDPKLLNDISTTFNQATVGIAFNSYSPRDGQEIVYLNQAARTLLSPSGHSYQPGYASRHRTHTRYEAITPQAVLDGLWIYQYGFDKPENTFVDGAYYRQIMLSELTFANTIFAVRPIPSCWLGEPATATKPNSAQPPALPHSAIGIEDLKTEVNFNGSYVGERAQIELMNKLVSERDAYLAAHSNRAANPTDLLTKYHHIDLLEIEIQVPRSFFDYIFESMAVFDAAGDALDQALQRATARGILRAGNLGVA